MNFMRCCKQGSIVSANYELYRIVTFYIACLQRNTFQLHNSPPKLNSFSPNPPPFYAPPSPICPIATTKYLGIVSILLHCRNIHLWKWTESRSENIEPQIKVNWHIGDDPKTILLYISLPTCTLRCNYFVTIHHFKGK